MSDAAQQPGRLYLVATPIGNLRDLSLRAIEVLGAVDRVLAEDTRQTRKLLAAHGLHAELDSYREHNHRQVVERILTELEAGRDLALVSDAGMPGISDPGAALVAAAVERGVAVVPLPGPCAAVAALAASGLPSDRFLFVGFLPRKPGARGRLLESLAAEPGSLIFYESPHRLGRCLTHMAAIWGPRRAVVARELTKVHETFERGRLDELAARFAAGARGEICVLVEGAAGAAAAKVRTAAELAPLVAALRAGRPLPAGRVAELLAPLTGVPRRSIYQLAAQQGGEEDSDDG